MPPELISITPHPDGTMTLGGSGFTPETLCTVNGDPVTVRYLSDTAISIVADANQAGSANITLTNPDGYPAFL